ncbi:Cytochrome P450 [Canna indica]|uniref:Cytochrome P450 n=1 Tax=Canna indica TaxID=4628 RepID=A0AAQ3JWZ5_9LILI|nr:Cytochrome P450 [Canna indica]
MRDDIPTKTPMFINTHALGRNMRNIDIDEFRPERHLLPTKGEGEQKRVEISHEPDFKILPFSVGKWKCHGAPLGVVVVLVALATHQ